jgi:peptide/nickel transport system permease protein
MKYLVRRVLIYIVVLVVVVNLDFFLPRLAPGNAAQVMVSGLNNAGVQKSREALLGLNASIGAQYQTYLGNIFLHWPPRFGVSFQFYPIPVIDLVASRIPWTLLLILSSLAITITLAYLMAARASLSRGGKFEAGSVYASILWQSTPIFWTAMVLLWVFGITLKWFPSFGNMSAGTSGVDYVLSGLYHSVLPIFALALGTFGEQYLILRGSVQEVLKSEYVLAAKTRGFRDRVIAMGYILRNSLLPLVAVLSFSLAGLISRSVLVEGVFGYNGVGDLFVDAVSHRDYPVLQGGLFIVTLIIIAGGIVGDLILVRLDPRLR